MCGKHFQLTEKLLWMVGGAAITYCISYIAYGAFYQQIGEREFISASAIAAPRAVALTKGAVVGRIRIPRLQISAVIFEGTEESELMKGVGHWQGSPTGGGGNVVLAAHRDTFFKGLKDVRPGDAIRLETAQGTSDYRVAGSQVVWPDSVEVLRPTESPTLTLITCYPFEFFGHAPQRFIVVAEGSDK